MTFGISYIHKDGRAPTGWEEIGGTCGTDTATLEDGRTLTVFPLLNDPSERSFLFTNPAGWFLRYDGLPMTLDAPFARRGRVFVSYGLSETVGLHASSRAMPGSSQESRGFAGRDPNDFINAEGNLPDDRTHMFRIQGSREIPRTGLLIGAPTSST